MKKVLVIFVLMFTVVLFGAEESKDLSLDKTLESLSGGVLQAYMAPATDGFGTNLNSGWFHGSPKDKKFGINIEIGAVVMGTMLGSSEQTFSKNATFQLTEDQITQLANSNSATVGSDTLINLPTVKQAFIDKLKKENIELSVSGPTITGSQNDKIIIATKNKSIDVVVSGITKTIEIEEYKDTIEIGGLLDGVDVIPTVAPQLTLGTVFGTQFTFRYVPTIEITDVGDFNYFGFGIQHNPKMFLNMLKVVPIDFAISYYTQSMTLGDNVDVAARAFGVNFSKRLGWRFLNITPYGGFMFESSEMNFSYDFVTDDKGTPNDKSDDDTKKISVDFEGENSFRFTLGMAIRLGIISVGADYNIAKIPSFAANIGVAF